MIKRLEYVSRYVFYERGAIKAYDAFVLVSYFLTVLSDQVYYSSLLGSTNLLVMDLVTLLPCDLRKRGVLTFQMRKLSPSNLGGQSIVLLVMCV